MNLLHIPTYRYISTHFIIILSRMFTFLSGFVARSARVSLTSHAYACYMLRSR